MIKYQGKKAVVTYALLRNSWKDYSIVHGGRFVMAKGKDLLQILWSGADVLKEV